MFHSYNPYDHKVSADVVHYHTPSLNLTFSLCSSVVVRFLALRFLSELLLKQTTAALPLLLSAVKDNGFSAILLVSLVSVISRERGDASFERGLGGKGAREERVQNVTVFGHLDRNQRELCSSCLLMASLKFQQSQAPLVL